MISCRDFRKRISPYMDGELTGRAGRAVEAHIAACPDCRRELERLKAMQRTLAALETPPLPPFLSTRIMARAAERPHILRILPLWMTAGTAGLSRRWLAACALACGLILGCAMGHSSFSGMTAVNSRQLCMAEGPGNRPDWLLIDQGSIEAATLTLLGSGI